jgi:hypothetical protein
MDDARIRELAAEVLGQLAGPAEPVASDLEARVAALERAVASGRRATPPTGAAGTFIALQVHPSHQLLDVAGGPTDGRCVLEPDKPCVGSGQCRTLGH